MSRPAADHSASRSLSSAGASTVNSARVAPSTSTGSIHTLGG
ncbi:hypothetical protein [Modestobacter roseus]|nr:hypothetical protein [Modestobacter roseus]